MIVAGAGLDGEITTHEFTERLQALGGTYRGRVTSDAATAVREALQLHPSEVSRLLAASATGIRGRVAIRDAGQSVEITDNSADIHSFDVQAVHDGSQLAPRLLGTTSLLSAGEVTRSVIGRSELDYEIQKANKVQARDRPGAAIDPAEALHRALDAARARGADYVTPRGISELAGYYGEAARPLLDALNQAQGTPLLWSVR